MEPREIANRTVDECESTNDLARTLGEAGYPHGTWVSTRHQTSGRGRLGREWKPIAGNLYLSYIARLEARREWTWIPLTTALAVLDAVRAVLPAVKLRVKWPNDLWLINADGFSKTGGILCEAQGAQSGSFIVIGIGLNCAGAPRDIDQRAAYLGIEVDRVRPLVVQALTARLHRLAEDPVSELQRIRREYDENAALIPGTRIEWGAGGVGLKDGKVLGLGESGELKVLQADGEEVRLFAEDVKIKIAAQACDGSPA